MFIIIFFFLEGVGRLFYLVRPEDSSYPDIESLSKPSLTYQVQAVTTLTLSSNHQAGPDPFLQPPGKP